jgi:hypothetical protein
MSIEQTLRSLTPHVIGVDPTLGLPQPNPADSVAFMYEWFEKGIPEYRLLTSAALFLLNLYSLLGTGRGFSRLGYRKQAELLEPLLKSRGLIPFLALFALSSPAVNAYYSRTDVQKALGFDVEALKAEANLRAVTRSSEPLPSRDTIPEPSGRPAS